MSNDLFKHLNPSQKKAVSHIDGPSIILAGAGSGKTRVLVHKVFYLVGKMKIPPYQILMITFTNKAAAEMRRRMGQTSIGYIGTFHSFCSRILRRESHHMGMDSNFIIYDDDDQSHLIKQILKKIPSGRFTPSYFLFRISNAKNQLVTPDRYLEFFSDYQAPKIAEVYEEYQKQLRKNKAYDFDDLLLEVVRLFKEFPQVLRKYQDMYRYIMVDEFQDTNLVQYELTRLLGEKYHHVTAVGDFSQSIYSWRGADMKNLEKFEQDFKDVKIFHLEQNYRSTKNILDFAYQVISKNQTHPVLHLFTENKGGEEIIFNEAQDEQEEAIYIANQIKDQYPEFDYFNFSVLYRTNAQSRAIEEAFLHYGIPYVLIGGTRFYERKEIRDILSYLRLLIHPADDVAVERIRKLGKKRFDDFQKTSEKVSEKVDKFSTAELMEQIFEATHYLGLYNPDDEEDYSRLENIKELKSVALNFPELPSFLEQVALVESEYSEGEKKSKSKDGVRLMTLHQAKGLEFPVVFIAGVEEGILPHSRSLDNIHSLEEERRLFYVGITRAIKKLYITYTRGRIIFGRRGASLKSRFIENETDLQDPF